MVSNRSVQIYLARGGVEIGVYPREQLEELARAGQVQPNDHYWHEGMADWLLLSDLLSPDAWKPLPPVPIHKHWLAVPAVIGGAFLVAALIAISLINSRSSGNAARATSFSMSSPAPDTRPSDPEVRDRAAADLEQKVQRLPGRAAPPLNTFYFDVRVDMQKSLAARTPWTALIRGDENVVDPATQQTTKRTQFTVTADYHDGTWTFRHYRATRTDLTDGAITEIEDDEEAPTPPSIVGMLGLTREYR